MSFTTQSRDRLNQLRQRAHNARAQRKRFQEQLQAAESVGDQDAIGLATLGLDQAQVEVETADALVNQAVSMFSGGSASDLSGVFDNPDTIGQLERWGNSTSTPIGTADLGYLYSKEEYVQRLQSGDWGGPRLAAAAPPDTDIGAPARYGAYGGVKPAPRRRLRLTDLIPTSTMDGASFAYTQELTTFDADTAETAEGAIKPSANIDYSTTQWVTAQTIATWLRLKRQQLSDVPALAQQAQETLLYKVARRRENQIVAGNGTGSNLLGILNVTGIATVPFSAGAVLADLVSTGIATILTSEFEPDAVVLNPNDLEAMWVAKTSGSGAYFGQGPFMETPDQLWGLPAIASTVVPVGQAIVGSWQMGCRLYVREAPLLRVSDADQDAFVRNEVVMLAEERVGFAVFYPTAFALVHLK